MSSSSPIAEVDMASVSKHGAVSKMAVDLNEEYSEGMQPLKADVPIQQLVVSHKKKRKTRGRRANFNKLNDSSTSEDPPTEEVRRARRRMKKNDKESTRKQAVVPPTSPTHTK